MLFVSALVNAETYSIVFRSGNADSSTAATSYTSIIEEASDNMVTGASVLNKIYRAKPGYGIKGGTGSAKGELTLLLDQTYYPTQLTIYAAAGNVKDTAATKGIDVCGQTILWEAGHRMEIRPYTIPIGAAGLNAISIAARVSSNNRFYVQKIEFTCPDPNPNHVKLQLPLQIDFGSCPLLDGEPADESTIISVRARCATDSLLLRLKSGKDFSLSTTKLPAAGGDLAIAFHATYVSPFADTLLVTAHGSDGLPVTARMPLKASTFHHVPSVQEVDSSCMQISETPGDYYLPAEGLADEALKTALSEIIHCGVRYRYGSGSNHTWEGFFLTDRDTTTQQVLDMYSCEVRFFNPANPTASVPEFDIEHMFPKSWWGGDVNGAYQDLYHLVPGDYSANRSKSNNAPGYVQDTTFWNGSFATGSNAAYPVSRVFCPADEYKGDFARAYFYIATCYENLQWVEDAGSAPALAMDNNSYLEFRPWLQEVLLSWHRLDPVSEKECRRAVAVNSIQGNRNPFIDYPALVEFIWGDRQGEAAHFANLTCSFTGNITTNLDSLNSKLPPLNPKLNSKVLRNGQLLILTPHGTFNAQGQRVE